MRQQAVPSGDIPRQPLRSEQRLRPDGLPLRPAWSSSTSDRQIPPRALNVPFSYSTAARLVHIRIATLYYAIDDAKARTSTLLPTRFLRVVEQVVLGEAGAFCSLGVSPGLVTTSFRT